MDARAEALAVDFSLALGAVAAGVLAGAARSLWSLPIVALGFAALVAPLSPVEHGELLALVEDRRPASLVAVALLTFAVAGTLVAGRLVVSVPSASLLVGTGLGLGSYRTVYGLAQPVPDRRLAETTNR